MREHRREPGRGTRSYDDAADHHPHHAVGKTTRVAQLSSAGGDSEAALDVDDDIDGDDEPLAEASRKKYTEHDVRGQFNDARSYATFLYNEREHAIEALQRRLRTGAKHIDTNVLAHLAKVALGVAGNSLQGKIAKGLAKGAAFLVNHYLKDKSKDHVPEDNYGGPVESFIQMQLKALDKGSLNIGLGINDAEEKVFNDLEAGSIKTVKGAFRRAHAFSRAIARHRDEAFQLQYNVSLQKWFSAIAGLTFGREKGGASDIDDHLSTRPVVPGHQNYAHGYTGKGGFVHVALTLSYKHALRLDAFTTPGIPNHIWQYRREDEHGSLGSIALNHLPGKQHLPVIADVKMVLRAGSEGVKDHFPAGRNDDTGQYQQPVAISWNERNRVHTELPTTDQFGATIQGDDRKWLSEQIGKAVGTDSASEAGDHIMRKRVGVHSLEQLAGAVGKRL